jgi:hypothetical protein
MWANFVLEKAQQPNSWMCHVTCVADNDRCKSTCIAEDDKSALIRYV